MMSPALTSPAPPLEVPARSIPLPESISPLAQAELARALPKPFAFPQADDSKGWRAVIAAWNSGIVAQLQPQLASILASVETENVDGVPVHVIVPDDLRPELQHRVVLDVHGGGYVFGAGEACKLAGILAARRFQAPIWSVDYRMPPDHPYPAALDDCLTAYRALLQSHPPEDIIVSGGSAGGGLAAALLLRARDEALPLPAAAVLLTPEVDLTESGDTFHTLLGIDNVLTQSLRDLSQLYAGGHDLADPYLSPLFGDFSKGFPPTFLQTGTRDLFLSNTVRLHRALRAAGLTAELHVFEAMAHGSFPGAPENDDLDAEIRRFVAAHWHLP